MGDRRHVALCDVARRAPALAQCGFRGAELASRAQPTLEELGLIHEAARATLFRGLAALNVSRFSEAERLLHQASTWFEEEGNDVCRALALLFRAELCLMRKRPREALELARHAARMFGRTTPVERGVRARVLRTRVSGWPEPEARRQCGLALDRLEALRSPCAFQVIRAREVAAPARKGRHLLHDLRWWSVRTDACQTSSPGSFGRTGCSKRGSLLTCSPRGDSGRFRSREAEGRPYRVAAAPGRRRHTSHSTRCSAIPSAACSRARGAQRMIPSSQQAEREGRGAHPPRSNGAEITAGTRACRRLRLGSLVNPSGVRSEALFGALLARVQDLLEPVRRGIFFVAGTSTP